MWAGTTTLSLLTVCRLCVGWVILAQRRLPNSSLAADTGAMGTNASFNVTACCKNGNFAMKNWYVESERAKHEQIVSTCIQWCVLHNLYSYGRSKLIYLWFI